MRLVLDRIEKTGDGKRIAVFEYGESFYYIDESKMPKGFMDELFEGAILEGEIEESSLKNPVILKEETEKEQQKMKNRLNNLFNRNKK